MVCMYCGKDTQVVNSRARSFPYSVWRRRKCPHCKNIFSTYETPGLDKAVVLAKGKDILPFSRDQLFLSVYQSVAHRPDAIRSASALTDTILTKLLAQLTHASLDRKMVVKTVATVLRRFDKAAATYYEAYHPVDKSRP
jgi:transcriptional repressor NrdR